MLNSLSMTRKLMITLVPLIVIALLVITLLLNTEVKETSTRQAIDAAHLLATEEGNNVLSQLNYELQQLKGLASVARSRTLVPVKQRRLHFDALLKQYLQDRPALIGSWTLWEPDAFDGLDNNYRNTVAHDASGRYIPYWYRDGQGNIQSEALVDYETPGAGDYYLLSKESQKATILDPYFYEIDGRPRLITSIVVPVLENGHFKGVVGVDLLVEEIQKQVSKIHPYGSGVAALFTNNAVIVAHPDEKRLGKNAEQTEGDISGEALPALLQSIRSGNAFETVTETPLFEGKTLILNDSIALSDTGYHWNLAVAVPMSKVTEEADLLVRHILIICLVSLAALIMMIIVVARNISSPLSHLAKALNDIAHGDGDLTRRLDVKGSDEVATLSQSFNTFAERIRSLVSDIAQRSEQISAISVQLEGHSQGSRDDAQQQSHEVEMVASAMNQMSATVSEVANNAQHASDSTRIGDQQINNGQKIIDSVVHSIRQQADDLKTAAKAISALEQGSQEIGDVINVIREIADQTNLLALNAAIEAARAGEHGRGFAVVADEVRTLANRTHSSTQEIENTIANLQQQTETAVHQMNLSQQRSEASVNDVEKAREVLGQISDEMKQISGMNLQIASATEQQSATAEELLRNVQQISSVADRALQGASETADSSEQLRSVSVYLTESVKRFKY